MKTTQKLWPRATSSQHVLQKTGQCTGSLSDTLLTNFFTGKVFETITISPPLTTLRLNKTCVTTLVLGTYSQSQFTSQKGCLSSYLVEFFGNIVLSLN